LLKDEGKRNAVDENPATTVHSSSATLNSVCRSVGSTLGDCRAFYVYGTERRLRLTQGKHFGT